MTQASELIALAERWEQFAVSSAREVANGEWGSLSAREQSRDIAAIFEVADHLRARAQVKHEG